MSFPLPNMTSPTKRLNDTVINVVNFCNEKRNRYKKN